MEVESTTLESIYGIFNFYCFSWGQHEEDNILGLTSIQVPSNPIVRVQSACYSAEIFRSLDCDCHEQLTTSINKIANEGGILLYMLCDGRGAGLLNKIRGLELGRKFGLDTSDAYREMKIEQDPRDYSRVVEALSYLGVQELRLLTNNPRKVSGLANGGLEVHREPLEIQATSFSESYLRTKAAKMGHLLEQFENKEGLPE